MDKYVADILRKGDSFTAVVRKNSVLPHGGEVRVIYDGQVRDSVTVRIVNTVTLKRDNIEEIRDLVRNDENPEDVLKQIAPSRSAPSHVRVLNPDSPTSELHPNRIEEAG